MDIAVMIVGCWLAVSVVAAFTVASFIRDNRTAPADEPLGALATPADRA